MKTAYSQVYSKIKGMPPVNRFTKDRTTQKVLRDFDKKNNAEYEELYNQYLEIMRDGVVSLFNSSKKKSLDYIKTEVLRDAPDVPTLIAAFLPALPVILCGVIASDPSIKLNPVSPVPMAISPSLVLIDPCSVPA